MVASLDESFSCLVRTSWSLISLSGSLNQICIRTSLSCGVWTWLRTTFDLEVHVYYSLWSSWSQKIPSNIICMKDLTPIGHLFHSYKFCSISWHTYHLFLNDILSWMNLNKLLLNASKTEFSLDCLKFLILLRWYHSEFLCSQSWLHLWLWCLSLIKSNLYPNLDFHIRDIRRIRHLLPLSAALEFTCSSKLDSLWHLTSQSQQKRSKLIGSHHKHLKIPTHHTNTQKTTLASKWIDYKLCDSHIQNTYRKSLSFPRHSVSTRSCDSLVLSIDMIR